MKKTLSCIFLICMIFMLFCSTALAAGENIDVLRYNVDRKVNAITSVMTVDLLNNGAQVTTDVPAMTLESKTMVPIRFISDILGAQTDWDQTNRQAVITMNDTTIKLEIGESTALINDEQTPIPGEVSVELITYDGAARVMVPVRFVSEELEALVHWDGTQKTVNVIPTVTATVDPNAPDESTEPDGTEGEAEDEVTVWTWAEWSKVNPVCVVIDPGHGGNDPGAQGFGQSEKDITMAIATKTTALLEAQNITVIMTRTQDEYLALVDRALVGTDNEATLFVSIHCNSFTTATPHGTETYYYINSTNQYDIDLATDIQDSVIAATGMYSRGVKSANFSVLRNSSIPAALIETAFISNADDNAKLKDETFQNTMAEGISGGIMKFLRDYGLIS